MVSDSLPTWIHRYIAAIFDTKCHLYFPVRTSMEHDIGYRITTKLIVNSELEKEVDLICQYLSDLCVNYTTFQNNPKGSGAHYGSQRIRIKGHRGVKTILSQIRDYTLLRRQEVDLLLDEFYPRMDQGFHLEKQGFIEMVKILDEFREIMGRGPRETHSVDYFIEKWDIDPRFLSYIEPTPDDDFIQPALSVGVDSWDFNSKIRPYIAGLVDSKCNLIVTVKKTDDTGVGYRVAIKIRFKTKQDLALLVFDDYCRSLGINATITRSDEESRSDQIALTARDDIEIFLTSLRDYLLVRRDAVDLLLDSILPALENGKHLNRETFPALIAIIDTFRQKAGRGNRAKYTLDYFLNEWDLDPDSVDPIVGTSDDSQIQFRD